MKQKNNTLLIVGIVVLAVLFLGSFGTMGFGGRGMMGSYYGSGWMVMLLLTLLVLVGIIWFLNQLNGGTMNHGKKK